MYLSLRRYAAGMCVYLQHGGVNNSRQKDVTAIAAIVVLHLVSGLFLKYVKISYDVRCDNGCVVHDWSVHWRSDSYSSEDEHHADSVHHGHRRRHHRNLLLDCNDARMSRGGVVWNHHAGRVSAVFVVKLTTTTTVIKWNVMLRWNAMRWDARLLL